jgi:hypothetical protein
VRTSEAYLRSIVNLKASMTVCFAQLLGHMSGIASARKKSMYREAAEARDAAAHIRQNSQNVLYLDDGALSE